MNYIVLDLEWNQNPSGREEQVDGLPFEIVEIGAVKLDSERNIVSEFSEIIKPQVYHKLHFKTKEIIQMKIEDFENGEDFKTVASHFFQWCGKDVRFCTWGEMDLMELQRNMDYYNIGEYMESPVMYYDVQKIFSLMTEGKKNPKSLEAVVDYMKIKKEEHFHRAVSDARYTALIFQKLDIDVIKEYYSVDYYHNPKSKEEEIHLVYDTYSKDISQEYDTKEEALLDKDIRATVCYRCGKKAAKKIRWFSLNSKQYYCLAFCRQHGFIKGRIRIKKNQEGRVFIVKILKLVAEEEADEIRLKREELKKRRKEKKYRQKENEKKSKRSAIK